MAHTTETRLTAPVSERDWCQGPDTGTVTLLEYGDYEHPECAAAHLVVRDLLRDLGDRVRYVFRHFPLISRHTHALHAAEVAEAAGAQERFWPMHDLLFLRQDRLDDEHLVQYAVSVGCNEDRVRRELETHLHADRVKEDFTSGVKSGVNRPPTFFIDEVRFDGPADVKSLGAAIHEAGATKRA